MKKKVTRRRAALRWSALAVALILAWAVVKDYTFTPYQARRAWWAVAQPQGQFQNMEELINLGWDHHPYMRIIRDASTRHLIFANDQWVVLGRDSIDLSDDGWWFCTEDSIPCVPEEATILPEATVWAKNYYAALATGYLYFCVEDLAAEVTGFTVVEAVEGAEGTIYAPPGPDHEADFRGKGSMTRSRLVYNDRGRAYGAFVYYSKLAFDRLGSRSGTCASSLRTGESASCP